MKTLFKTTEKEDHWVTSSVLNTGLLRPLTEIIDFTQPVNLVYLAHLQNNKWQVPTVVSDAKRLVGSAVLSLKALSILFRLKKKKNASSRRRMWFYETYFYFICLSALFTGCKEKLHGNCTWLHLVTLPYFRKKKKRRKLLIKCLVPIDKL